MMSESGQNYYHKQNEYMKYLEQRLSQWAEWFSHGNWYGIGYPFRWSQGEDIRKLYKLLVFKCFIIAPGGI